MPVAAKHLRPLPSPKEELDALFRAHHDQVYRAAFRVTGSSADAEDVLQTVFLRLARREDGADLSPSPGSYLHRAAVNAALDVVRARTRSGAVAIEEVEPARSESLDADPEAALRDSELRGHIRAAVSSLNPRAAELFALRYFEDHTNAEIAEMLGMSQMVVAVLLHRARTRVRTELGRLLGRN